MAHLIIQYSENLGSNMNMSNFCNKMNKVMQATNLFPLAGIRVRAHPMLMSSIADQHPDNAFVDMILRMGEGRSDEQKSNVGLALMVAAEAAFAVQLAQPHFALSLEIIVISKLLSWKKNSIHPRLKAK